MRRRNKSLEYAYIYVIITIHMLKGRLMPPVQLGTERR